MRRLSPAITSRANTRVKALRASLSGEARRSGDLLGLEGPNLIREAHFAGMSFEIVFLREGSEDLLARDVFGDLRATEWAVLSPEIFDGAVSTANPQGIAATWVIRDPAPQASSGYAGLVLENIQDPGNLGTLIRSAAAFGIGDVLVTPETANQWNPKVVRSAAGALFHTRVQRLPLGEIAGQMRAKGVRLFAAVSGFLSGPEFGYPALAARHGVLTGRMENDDAGDAYRHPGYPASQQADDAERYAASVSPDTDFVEPCAIMVGNEGAGLSAEARKLADEQVMIPCSVESLNAAVAGSVLMYEIMRQRTLRIWARGQGLRS